jgi:hypothetical protein
VDSRRCEPPAGAVHPVDLKTIIVPRRSAYVPPDIDPDYDPLYPELPEPEAEEGLLEWMSEASPLGDATVPLLGGALGATVFAILDRRPLIGGGAGAAAAAAWLWYDRQERGY